MDTTRIILFALAALVLIVIILRRAMGKQKTQ